MRPGILVGRRDAGAPPELDRGERPHRLGEPPRRLAAEVGVAGLSMGMSGDWRVAVEEGSTCVRIGTAIFGARG